MADTEKQTESTTDVLTLDELNTRNEQFKLPVLHQWSDGTLHLVGDPEPLGEE